MTDQPTTLADEPSPRDPWEIGVGAYGHMITARPSDMFIGIGRSMLFEPFEHELSIDFIMLSQMGSVDISRPGRPRSFRRSFRRLEVAIDAVSRRTRRAQASGRTARAQWLAIEHLRRLSHRGLFTP